MPNIYVVHHEALLSSGSDHIVAYFHPLFRRRSAFRAEGPSCLQAVPVEVFSSSDQSPVSLCASSNRPAKQTGSVRHAFRLLLSSSVDQRECSPAGLSLPPFSLSPQLQTAVVLGDTLLDCLCLLRMWIWMCSLGNAPGCSVHRNLRRMHHGLSAEYASVCISQLGASQNNTAHVSQHCKVVCGATRCLLSWSQGSHVKRCCWYPNAIWKAVARPSNSRGPVKITSSHRSTLNTQYVICWMF